MKKDNPLNIRIISTSPVEDGTNSAPALCVNNADTNERLKELDSDDSGSEDEFAEETVDPRVEGVLEEMTSAMEKVNKVENAISAARRAYRQAIINGDHLLKATFRQSGVRSAVEKTKPYYVARETLQKAREDAKAMAGAYQRAANALEEAQVNAQIMETRAVKELKDATPSEDMTDVAKALLISVSNASQDRLNQATAQVNQCKNNLDAISVQYLQVTRKVAEHQTRFRAEQDKAQYEPMFAMRLEKAEKYYQAKNAVKKSVDSAQEWLEIVTTQMAQAKKRYALASQGIADLSEDISSHRATPRTSTPSSLSLTNEVSDDGNLILEQHNETNKTLLAPEPVALPDSLSNLPDILGKTLLTRHMCLGEAVSNISGLDYQSSPNLVSLADDRGSVASETLEIPLPVSDISNQMKVTDRRLSHNPMMDDSKVERDMLAGVRKASVKKGVRSQASSRSSSRPTSQNIVYSNYLESRTSDKGSRFAV